MSDSRIPSDSAERTREIGEALGRALEPGDVVVLDGDLGAGKTTLTQGIARGMGIDEHVTSPTFVVARELPATRATPLLHVDAYRISSLHEWDDLDLDLASGATVVEWGERVADALPEDRLEIRIQSTDGHSDRSTGRSNDDRTQDARLLRITARGPRSVRLLSALDACR